MKDVTTHFAATVKQFQLFVSTHSGHPIVCFYAHTVYILNGVTFTAAAFASSPYTETAVKLGLHKSRPLNMYYSPDRNNFIPHRKQHPSSQYSSEETKTTFHYGNYTFKFKRDV